MCRCLWYACVHVYVCMWNTNKKTLTSWMAFNNMWQIFIAQSLAGQEGRQQQMANAACCMIFDMANSETKVYIYVCMCKYLYVCIYVTKYGPQLCLVVTFWLPQRQKTSNSNRNNKNFHFVCHRRAAEKKYIYIKTSVKNFILFLYVFFFISVYYDFCFFIIIILYMCMFVCGISSRV